MARDTRRAIHRWAAPLRPPCLQSLPAARTPPCRHPETSRRGPRESTLAPKAKPTPVPIASPMSVFRPRCPSRFSETRRMSCRESVSWLVVALIASASGVTRCTNPRRIFPVARVTRISEPGTSWLRLAQFPIGLACWAAAVAARVAANRAGKKMCLDFLVMARTFEPETRRANSDKNHTPSRTTCSCAPSTVRNPSVTGGVSGSAGAETGKRRSGQRA